MFNLEKELLKWKIKLLEMKYLTNEDTDELESHILDKVYDLNNRGYTLEEAFNMAKNDLGSLDLLNDEYMKVNKTIPFQRKIGYGVLGFIIISFMLQLQFLITTIITLSLGKKSELMQTIYMPIISDLLNFILGSNYNNKLSIIVLIISTILSTLSIYLILSNKINIIKKYVEIVEKYKYKNILNVFLLLVIPLGLMYISNIILSNFATNNIYKDILLVNSVIKSLSNIILFIAFTFEISKNNSKNKFKFIALTGYITIILIFENIPISLSLLLRKLIISNFSLYFLVYSITTLLVIYYLGISKDTITLKIRRFLNHSNKSFIIGLLALLIYISKFLLMPVYTRCFTVELIGDMSIKTFYVKGGIITLLLCITCLYSFIYKFINNSKKKKYI